MPNEKFPVSPPDNEWLRQNFLGKGNKPDSPILELVTRHIVYNLDLINPALTPEILSAYSVWTHGRNWRQTGEHAIELVMATYISSTIARLDINMDHPKAVVICGMAVADELTDLGRMDKHKEIKFNANVAASRLRAGAVRWGKENLGADQERSIWVLGQLAKPMTFYARNMKTKALGAYLEGNLELAEKFLQRKARI